MNIYKTQTAMEKNVEDLQYLALCMTPIPLQEERTGNRDQILKLATKTELLTSEVIFTNCIIAAFQILERAQKNYNTPCAL